MGCQAPLNPISLINVKVIAILCPSVKDFRHLCDVLSWLVLYGCRFTFFLCIFDYMVCFLVFFFSSKACFKSAALAFKPGLLFHVHVSFLICLLFSLHSLTPASSPPFSFRSRLWSQQ